MWQIAHHEKLIKNSDQLVNILSARSWTNYSASMFTEIRISLWNKLKKRWASGGMLFIPSETKASAVCCFQRNALTCCSVNHHYPNHRLFSQLPRPMWKERPREWRKTWGWPFSSTYLRWDRECCQGPEHHSMLPEPVLSLDWQQQSLEWYF